MNLKIIELFFLGFSHSTKVKNIGIIFNCLQTSYASTILIIFALGGLSEGEFFLFSWYKKIIHVWQMLTSIIKIEFYYSKYSHFSWSYWFYIWWDGSSIIICKIQAVWIQLARKYFEEKITKQKNWKFGGNFAYIFFIKREFLEPSHSLLLPKRLRAFLATQLYFAGSIACLGQNQAHTTTMHEAEAAIVSALFRDIAELATKSGSDKTLLI